MFAPAEPFLEWAGFPWGLQVLLAGKDTNCLNNVRLGLERAHYNVTMLRRGEDAIAALGNSERLFHLALVEATQDDEFDGFKVLKAASDVPTIMLMETENMATVMQGIVLGAADFLQQPLTDEKLRNVWHHVARKALIAGGQKPQPWSKLQLESRDCFCQSTQGTCSDTQDSSPGLSKNNQSFRRANNERMLRTVKSLACEKPLTLQRPQGVHSKEAELCDHVLELSPASDGSSEVKPEIQQPQKEVVNSTHERVYSEIKFEDYACSRVKYDNSLEDIGLSDGMILEGDEGADAEIGPSIFTGLPDSDSDSVLDFNVDLLDPKALQDVENEEEDDFLASELLKLEEDSFGVDMLESFLQSPSPDSGECMKEQLVGQMASNGNKKSDKTTGRKKKVKVDWTADLHHKFVQAVEHLGVEKAIPSKILDLMGVKCLTRHNIASHLQKYRSHRKHHLYRESRAASWRAGRFSDLIPWVGGKRDGTQPHKSYLAPIQPRLPVAVYPVQPTGPFSRPPLHVWGHPTVDHSSAHMWHQPSANAPTAWCSPDGTFWQHPAASLDSWVSTSRPLAAPSLPHPPNKIPLPPASSTIQVGVPIVGREEEFIFDHVRATDSRDSELNAGAGAANSEKPLVHLPKEIVDAVINEVLKNPITAFPLGLKPPPLESVMAELQKQGITGIGRYL